jgi:hypothetical protein
MSGLTGAYKKGGESGVEKQSQDNELVFHTLFDEEFRGSSAEEVVQALYENSRQGMGDISFDDWWKYQTTVWENKYGMSVPSNDTPRACEKLLEILVDVGALEKGPLPKGNKKTLDI